MAYNLRILPMQKWNGFPRLALILTLLIALCAVTFSPHVEVAEAKPNKTPATNVVISEFRFRGDGGGTDEFIELYNPTNSAIDISGWWIRRSSNSGSTFDVISIPVDTVTTNFIPGQHYLIANTGYSGGSVTADLSYSVTGIADDGGVALTLSDKTTIVDQVGLSTDSAYKEGSPQVPLTSDIDQGYSRKNNGCSDTNNNLADFSLSNPSSPLNSSSVIPCLYVTNVTSSKPNGIYTSGEVIDIDVTFSSNVNVTGNPTLLLETGITDRNAIYISVVDDIITFRYTVASTDSSLRLDYASTTALSLNGGSITGAVGDALLDLPAPGASGSLGFNRNIQIDAVGNPSIVSFKRQNPTAMITTSNSLTFRVVFSEAVKNVDSGDFVVTGLTAPDINISNINGNTYDVVVTNGDIDTFNGTVGLNISPTVSIVDVALIGNPLPSTPEPSIDETYTLDNTPPSVVSINQISTQADPTSVQPVRFTIIFSEAIDSSTFTSSDITQSGTATGATWYVSTTSDPKIYNLSATASGSGTLIPAISAGQLKDLAGNDNAVFTDGDCGAPEPNNCVTLNVTGNPTVTVNQASGQADPTGALPINFTVQFSEPINTATFTTSDITQNGTATNVVWSIANSGDSMTFTLSATSSGYGTIQPSIAANTVIDLSGNNNSASTSTDNTVEYVLISNAVRSVIINEVAWAGTTSGLTDDEWIELYNPGSSTMNISGWRLKATDGDPDILIPNGKTIPAGGFYLLERDNDNTVSDIAADQIYSGALSNSGEILTLYDPTNKVIDTANGNGGSWPAGSSSTYGTMERRSGTTDSDSAWATNTGVKKNGKNADGGDILGTPKSSNTPAASVTPVKTSTPFPTSTPIPAAVVIDPRPIINEILPRPGFDWNQDGRVDVFDEFIEIKNLTAIDINLSGWVLDDEKDAGSDPYTIPSVTLKPGQRIVFYGLETNILLSDGGDTVRLIHPTNGKIYDAYTYSIAKNEDLSICRLPDGNVFGGWYDDCIPTPNLTNTREGVAPSMPGGGYESPVCELPDTLSEEFLFAECHGYGANIWNAFYWDESGWLGTRTIPQNLSKWETFIK